MKTCTKCKQEKDLSFFNVDKYGKGGYDPQCRDCRKEGRIKWGGSKTSLDKSRAATKKIKEDIKDKGCCLCGYKGFYSGLEFHHIEDPCNGNVNRSPANIHNVKKLKEELMKCVCLCSICHNAITFGELDGEGLEPFLITFQEGI